MSIRQWRILGLASTLAAAGLLSACGGDEAAFVKACMSQGSGAQMMGGGNQEEFCKCSAHTAKANMSGKAFHALVLQSQGKQQEANDILSKLDSGEQAQMVAGSLKILGECAKLGN